MSEKITEALKIKPLMTEEKTDDSIRPFNKKERERNETISFRIGQNIYNKIEAIVKLSGHRQADVCREAFDEKKLDEILDFYKKRLP